jgi:sugar phosphate isomerase/epimerase
MRIGAMNHPMRNVDREIRRFRELGFDFVDLTLEPDQTRPRDIDVGAVRRVLDDTAMAVVGHTAWYLPIGSPFDSVRRAALDELTVSLDVFAALGATRMNVHPDHRAPSLFAKEWLIERNVESLTYLVDRARERRIQLMLENVAGLFGQPSVLRHVFERLRDLAFHLDVGHANLGGSANLTPELLTALPGRLAHVHLSDNKGGDADLHLPLGVGTIDWRWAIDLLKRSGFDDTITLEVFSPDDEYLAISRRKVRQLWDEVASA